MDKFAATNIARRKKEKAMLFFYKPRSRSLGMPLFSRSHAAAAAAAAAADHARPKSRRSEKSMKARDNDRPQSRKRRIFREEEKKTKIDMWLRPDPKNTRAPLLFVRSSKSPLFPSLGGGGLSLSSPSRESCTRNIRADEVAIFKY